MITHGQLAVLGYTHDAIKHRIRTGRLFRVHRGVYALGRRELSQRGRWLAALLACGDDAALSHESAAAFWRLAKEPEGAVHVTVIGGGRSRAGIVIHRRSALHATTRDGMRVTTPAQTLIDVAAQWPPDKLEQAIGEATLRGLVGLKALRTAATKAGRSGAALRRVVERLGFRVTQSELERAFLRLVEEAELPLPETQTRLGKHRVDFYWPEIGLVVETDGARFHATAAQQAEDRKRDQAHIRAGRMPMRVTHWQVVREPAETTTLLADVFTALACRPRSASTKRAA